MNVQLRHSREFLAGFWSPDEDWAHTLTANLYQIELNLLTQTQDQGEINVAVGRALYMIDAEFTDTVFFGDSDHEAADLFAHMGVNVTTLPGPAVDQIIGMMLYCKLQAVMEQRVVIQKLEISSVKGNHVWYVHDDLESLGPFTGEGWWHQPDTVHCRDPHDRDDIAKIQPNVWKDLSLDWPGTDQPNSKILYVDFSRK